MSLLAGLELVFEEAIGNAYPHLVDPPVMVTPSTKPGFGDYQCNSAMTIAKVMCRAFLFFTHNYLCKVVVFY